MRAAGEPPPSPPPRRWDRPHGRPAPGLARTFPAAGAPLLPGGGCREVARRHPHPRSSAARPAAAAGSWVAEGAAAVWPSWPGRSCCA